MASSDLLHDGIPVSSSLWIRNILTDAHTNEGVCMPSSLFLFIQFSNNQTGSIALFFCLLYMPYNIYLQFGRSLDSWCDMCGSFRRDDVLAALR